MDKDAYDLIEENIKNINKNIEYWTDELKFIASEIVNLADSHDTTVFKFSTRIAECENNISILMAQRKIYEMFANELDMLDD